MTDPAGLILLCNKYVVHIGASSKQGIQWLGPNATKFTAWCVDQGLSLDINTQGGVRDVITDFVNAQNLDEYEGWMMGSGVADFIIWCRKEQVGEPEQSIN